MDSLPPTLFLTNPLSGRFLRVGDLVRWGGAALALAVAAAVPPLSGQEASATPAAGTRIDFPGSLAPLPRVGAI